MHTPGPWKLDLEALQIGLPVQEVPGEYAWIELDGAYDFFLNDIPEEELQANARLIAAAPEMLALLEGMWEAYHDPAVYWHDKLIAVRNLVNKVKGE